MARPSTIAARLKALRVRGQLTWKQLAQVLRLSESMIYQAVRGDAVLGDKALYRLENAEIRVGLKPPNPLVTHAVLHDSDPDTVERFGKRLRWVRQFHSLSVKDFARRLGVDASEIAALETGENRNPSEAFVKAVGDTFGVSTGWLGLGEGMHLKDEADRIHRQRVDFPSLQMLSREDLGEVLNHFQTQAMKQKGYIKEVYLEFIRRIFAELIEKMREPKEDVK